MAQPTVEILAHALRQAAAAHGIHEAQVLGGEYDAEWPQWYAEHMTGTLTEGGLQLTTD